MIYFKLVFIFNGTKNWFAVFFYGFKDAHFQLSVFIDTLLVCTATAMMCLSSGIQPSAELSGAPFVQTALASNFGNFGYYFITVSLLLFAFTTLLGKTAIAALNDYISQRKEGRDPVFKASSIRLKDPTDFWN